mmetsp:Transcript_15981/g.39410  ORF Transcript_15981/g.39410 Transcript_15981/m.39410 type:complete len:432 (-) Transcript_15981:741-2036(-)
MQNVTFETFRCKHRGSKKIQNEYSSDFDEKWENQAANKLLHGLQQVLQTPGGLRAELPLAGGFRNFLRVAAAVGFRKDAKREEKERVGFRKDAKGEERERADDLRAVGKSGFAVVVGHAGGYWALRNGCGGLQGLVAIAGGRREFLDAVGGIAVLAESVGGLKHLVNHGELVKVWGGFDNLVRDVGGYDAFMDAIGGFSVWAMASSKCKPTAYLPLFPSECMTHNFKEAVIVKAMRDHWHVKWVTPLPPLPTLKIPLELTKYGEQYSFELEIIKGNANIFWGATYNGNHGTAHTCSGIRGIRFNTSCGSHGETYFNNSCPFCRPSYHFLPCPAFETPEIRQLLKQRPLKVLLELDLRKSSVSSGRVFYNESMRITCGKASFLMSGCYSGPAVNPEYFRNCSERYYGNPKKILLVEGIDTEFRMKQTSGPVL